MIIGGIPETLKTSPQAVTFPKTNTPGRTPINKGEKGKKNQTVQRPNFPPRNTQEPFAYKSNATKRKGKGEKSNRRSPTQTGKRKPRTRLVLRGLVSRRRGMGKRMELNKRKRKRKVHGERTPFVNIGIKS